MDVVFSAPFAGAIYQWLEECMRAGGTYGASYYDESTPGYYRHKLRDATKTRPQALATLVMLDEIYIAAGDFLAPDSMRVGESQSRSRTRRFGASLGVTIGPNLGHDASRYLGSIEDVAALAQLPEFGDLFEGMTDSEVWHEIVDAVADSMLVGFLRRPLVCGAHRRRAINALLEIGVITQMMIFADESPFAGMDGDPLTQGQRITDVVTEYKELAALEFDAPTIEVLARVKDDERVRESAEAFQAILAGAATSDTRSELEDRLRSALSRNSWGNPTGRLLNLASVSLSVASLFPGPGAAAGIASLALPAVTTVLSPLARRASWFEIAPRMQYAASMASIENRLKP